MEGKNFEQLTLEDILNISDDAKNELSIKDLEDIIEELDRLSVVARKRHALEQKRLEREERERKAREKQEKNDAHIREVTCMDLPMDWENAFNSDDRTRGVHAQTPSDALVLSLTMLARVDIEYMSSVTGMEYKEVINSLRGSIYQNPQTWNECFYKGWETADEYLSGNIMRKWQAAKTANEKYKGYFSDNLKALQAVMPPAAAVEDIYITLGSPWVPPDVIDDFIAHLYGYKSHVYKSHDGEFDCNPVKHDEITGAWEIPYKTRYGHCITDTKTYGTERIEALHILEKTLNNKSITVTDKVNASENKRVINKDETILALEKQRKMIAEFQKWVWSDENRSNRLKTIYENNFGFVRRRSFDGSFLNFPTMSPDVTLYPYQKNAVARILFSPNTLLAHEVGSGKTYVMISAGMELRRMGLSKKNMYVVPNNIVGQWQNIFLDMYPNAKLLVVEPKIFTPSKRDKTLKKMRDEDFDGIIIAYSCFDRITLSSEQQKTALQVELAIVEEMLNDPKKSTSMLEKQKQKVCKCISELSLMIDETRDIPFDDLGVTRLFIDEAHNFKNVPLQTRIKALGINSDGSKKCDDMMKKVHYVQKNGGGVVMATATPITNTVAEVFIMQKYLQSGELALLDLQSFDSWVGMFAERATEFEIDIDTSGYRMSSRFAKFHNLPELTSLFSQIADFHKVDKENGIPDFDGYTDELIPKTNEFAKYLDSISKRANLVRAHSVKRYQDNMLLITTDGRKAALDLRLVLPNSGFDHQSKVARCAENVVRIYANSNGAQIIFCDTSTPKAGFNIYDEVKQLLVNLGIPPCEIAYIHDADNDKQRVKLFEMMRTGELRVLIGSTPKLGIGVNVQNKLIAIHHLDIPWRPADMTQREGRILRQGNENPKVEIYRYITEGSFDAYSWQLLETKQRFINELLGGTYSERDGDEISDTVLNYAEVKALAVGNPLVKKRVETANELTRYVTLQRKTVETRMRLETELQALPAKIEHQKQLITNAENDRDFYSSTPLPVTAAEKKADAEKRKALRETIFAAVCTNELKTTESVLTEYRGFQIVLPANMKKDTPFVWLQRTGKYYVELGSSELGVLVRIENFLGSLDGHIRKLRDNLDSMLNRETLIKAELENRESYSDRIEQLNEQIASIDKELGVDRK